MRTVEATYRNGDGTKRRTVRITMEEELADNCVRLAIEALAPRGMWLDFRRDWDDENTDVEAS